MVNKRVNRSGSVCRRGVTEVMVDRFTVPLGNPGNISIEKRTT